MTYYITQCGTHCAIYCVNRYVAHVVTHRRQGWGRLRPIPVVFVLAVDAPPCRAVSRRLRLRLRPRRRQPVVGAVAAGAVVPAGVAQEIRRHGRMLLVGAQLGVTPRDAAAAGSRAGQLGVPMNAPSGRQPLNGLRDGKHAKCNRGKTKAPTKC